MSEVDWTSYDEVAETYDAVSVPHYFARPAERLVVLLGISRGDRVLDVGAGTCVAAAAAARFGAHVIAADPSWAMLLLGRTRGVEVAVVARLPLLPFADASFDRISASFVLNHLADPSGALGGLRRVLAHSGRLAVTSWAVGPSDNEIGKLWNETAREFVDQEILDEQVGKALSGERRLAEPGYLRDLLSSAGLSVDSVRQIEFPISISVEDYLTSRSLAMTARFMKKTLPDERWRQFEQTAERQVLARFGRQLELTALVNFAVAAKQPAR